MRVVTIFLLLLAYAEYCVARAVSKRQLAPLDQPLCNVGPGPLNASIATSGKAQQNIVYMDTAHPITCEGRIDFVEVCFTIDDSRTGGFFFDLVSLRPQRDGYIVQYTIDIAPVLNEDEVTENPLSCQNITLTSRFPVKEGDLVGLRVVNSIEVAFAMFSYKGALSSADVEPTLGVEWISAGLGGGELRPDRTNDYELPMLRAFVVDDPDSDDNTDGSGSTPAPVPVSCPTSGPGDNAGNNPIGGGDGPGLGFDNIYNITYTSFLIGFVVSVVVAFFLFITVIGVGMSAIPGSKKCLKKVCCCSKKKKLQNKNFQQLSTPMEMSIQHIMEH